MAMPNRIAEALNQPIPDRWVETAWVMILLMTCIGAFVPFSPLMPGESLDPSWIFGMNQAVAQGLAFGRELIFTFGPYAAIYTKTFHPATDLMMLGGSLYLAMSFWLALVLLIPGLRWGWVAAITAVLAGAMYSRDALLFSYPLLVALASLKLTRSHEAEENRKHPLMLALLFAPLGLLPLIKGSMLISSAAVTVLCMLLFLIRNRYFLALSSLVTPLMAMLLFWLAAGQPPTDLPDYFLSMAHIISGYSEAMARTGNALEIIFYLITAIFLLTSIAIQDVTSTLEKLFLFCIYSIFLFLSFKSGFVRHDSHAIMAGASILTSALFLSSIFISRLTAPLLALSLGTWLYIDSNYFTAWPLHISHNISQTYLTSWNGLKRRITQEDWLEETFHSTVSAMASRAPFPLLPGMTDIYSYNQSYLIASGSSWSPRPILQSYSAYTPALAEINRTHLLGPAAPDNIIFRVEPIDKRLPALEDGPSWPELLRWYRPASFNNDFLLLHRMNSSGVSDPEVKLAGSVQTLGTPVELPATDEPLFVHIEIEPTLLGRLAALFFKPDQLQISVELKNGTKRQYRLIAGMARAGFMISPFIENTTEFGLLYGKETYLEGKEVHAFTISPLDENSQLWRDEYSVTFTSIPVPGGQRVEEVYSFNTTLSTDSYEILSTDGSCAASIEHINGMTRADERFAVGGVLQVKGWAALSVEQEWLPEPVLVTLLDEQGNRIFLTTNRTSREDVANHFNNPSLRQSGYTLIADSSSLRGDFVLGVAMERAGIIQVCPQIQIPVRIDG